MATYIDKSELDKLTKGVRELSAQTKRRIIKKAVAEVGKKATDKSKDQLGKTYNIPASEAQAVKMRTKEIAGGFEVRIKPTLEQRRRALKLHVVRDTKTRGVVVKVRKDKVKLFRHAFTATVGSGHAGVFNRTTNKRLPITELKTIGQQIMFGSKEVKGETERYIESDGVQQAVSAAEAAVAKALKRANAR